MLGGDIIRMETHKNVVYQWVILGIAIILITGAVVNNLYKSYDDILSGERSRLQTQARVVKENLSNRLASTDHALSAIRDDLALLPPSRWDKSDFEYHAKMLDQSVSGLRTVLVYDDKGTVRLANRKELVGVNFSYRDYFKLDRQNPNPNLLIVSPPNKTALGVWAMQLVKVIPGPNTKFAGIVLATLDPVYFQTLLSSVIYAPDMRVAITHESGVRFLMIPEVKGQAGKYINAGSMFSLHLASGNQNSFHVGKSYTTGDDRMIAMTTINPENLRMDKVLVVSVSRNKAAIISGWRTHALNQGFILCFISLSSVAALAGFQRHQRIHLRQVEHADAELRDSQQQLKEIIDFLPDATFVLDDSKRVVIWNHAMEEMTGVPEEQMIGKGDNECTIPFYGERRKHLPDLLDLDETELAAKYSSIKLNRGSLGAEAFCPELYGGKGAYVWAIAAPLYNSFGQRVGIVESIRDISDQKAVQAAMQQNQEYLRKLYHGIEHSASAVLITDATGTIEYVNRKFTQVTGYTVDEAIGKNPRILKSDTTPREVFDNLWKTILSGSEWRGELQNRRKNGEIYWSVASISPLLDDQGEITHFVANVEDINDRKNAEATIEHMAYYDPLTELPNRRMLKDRLDLAIKRSRRQGSKMALMYLDIDSFKHINDSLGHPAGDSLLREMAKRYCEALRDDDIVCRLGGDEFAVILHDIQRDEDVVLVANKLLAQTAGAVKLDDMEVMVTVSVGVALFPKDGEDGDSLGKHADIALYQAKRGGKNTFRFFSEELNNITREHMALEHALRHALANNELMLLYQPKICLKSGRVTGVEALIRWNSPDFGLVSPIRFIPIAEETHVIIEIGEWVLRSACRQQITWKQQGLDISMAVNLSAVQFKSPILISQISSILDETSIHPERLELELTESALIEKPDEAVHVLENLRSLGCGIAIDDFGTGYSSLSYLKAFPITVLKIDRSFVRDLDHDSGDRAIAQSVVALANNLKMITVAEGVENTEQQAILQELGCDYVQGFLYSRPVPADQIPVTIETIQQQLHIG